jgi:hypothetical protein
MLSSMHLTKAIRPALPRNCTAFRYHCRSMPDHTSFSSFRPRNASLTSARGRCLASPSLAHRTPGQDGQRTWYDRAFVSPCKVSSSKVLVQACAVAMDALNAIVVDKCLPMVDKTPCPVEALSDMRSSAGSRWERFSSGVGH